MHMDLQAKGWKTLGFTKKNKNKKKVRMEKVNIEDLKILI